MALVKEQKRDLILAAGLALFGERGFHGTAVPLVAERAGVAVGTIYRYFETKEALVNAIYQHQKAALLAFLQADFPLSAPPREQFHILWHRFIAFAQENQEALAFLEFHHHQPYLDEASHMAEFSLIAWLAERMTGAIEQQVLKDVPLPLLMALVWGAFVGMMKAAWAGQIDLTPELIEQAEACCWEAIRR